MVAITKNDVKRLVDKKIIRFVGNGYINEKNGKPIVYYRTKHNKIFVEDSYANLVNG